MLPSELAEGVVAGSRAALGRAITLVESLHPSHRARARELLRLLAPRFGGSHRIGVTGPPGAGKSTLIEALGLLAIERGERVAVLAIDPSSSQSGGSILGDKTRMERLSVHERAFVRPSPTGGTLGGVARRTRECVSVLEAAGYGRVLVETVGVGQSEVAVSQLVDTVLMVALPGSGDELQGIKRGLMEIADLVFVNKADGDNLPAARRAADQLSRSLRLLPSRLEGWSATVELGSAHSGEGLEALWQRLEAHRAFLAAGQREQSRARQSLFWFEQSLLDQMRERLHACPAARAALPEAQAALGRGEISPDEAAGAVLDAAGWK